MRVNGGHRKNFNMVNSSVCVNCIVHILINIILFSTIPVIIE